MRIERTKLEPRWLYVSAGALVATAVALLAFLLFVAGLLMHAANDAMAGL